MQRFRRNRSRLCRRLNHRGPRRVSSDATARPRAETSVPTYFMRVHWFSLQLAAAGENQCTFFCEGTLDGFVNTPLFPKPVYLRPFKVHWYTEIRVHWILYSHKFWRNNGERQRAALTGDLFLEPVPSSLCKQRQPAGRGKRFKRGG